MKVGVYLVDNITPSAGGNFSYYERLISAVDDYRFNDALEVCFTGRIPKGDVKLQKDYVQLPSPIVFKLFQYLRKAGLTKLLSRLFFTNADLCNRIDVSRLKSAKIDLLLYPKQFFTEVFDFPFMTMNWDAGHKSTFAFPEFLESYQVREKWYRVGMQKAMAIIVESEGSKEEYASYFSVPTSKIEIVPLFPGGVVDLIVESGTQRDHLANFKLSALSYFFYPAQFWAHKNHYNLIIAFKKLRDSNPSRDIKLVFTGSDKGNKAYIRSVISHLNLERDVLIFGFVSNEEIHTLYKNAIALVMPTFLGPTNMPVLEAQTLQTAVICSDLSGHRETCQDGAIYADPREPQQWTDAMQGLLIDESRLELIEKAKAVRATTKFDIGHAMARLEAIFLKFIPIRKTFQ
ncbi:MAG TPA: glycosyltransferase family 1 protein [Chryseolinea sp.]|nr:glycosyltransferase family 1 protein [Chryseolinea sp.]